MKRIRAFVLGSAFGSALGMLYAPRPGNETRALMLTLWALWRNQAVSGISAADRQARAALGSTKGAAAPRHKRQRKRATQPQRGTTTKGEAGQTASRQKAGAGS